MWMTRRRSEPIRCVARLALVWVLGTSVSFAAAANDAPIRVRDGEVSFVFSKFGYALSDDAEKTGACENNDWPKRIRSASSISGKSA